MSASPRPPIPSLIPESAPFTAEQRTCLNGLFAGLFGLSENVTPVSNAHAARLLAGLFDGGVGATAGEAPASGEADDGGAVDDAPWHDPAMPLPERMKLAEGKPPPRRLMAAMAQQDCGQCGYNCKDYADALVGKSEKRLNLCVPGGKETSRMLKQLYEELDGPPAAAPAPAPLAITEAAVPAQPKSAPALLAGRSRDNPVYAAFLSRRRSTSPARKKRPGISKSISPAPMSIMSSAIHWAFSPPTITTSLPQSLAHSMCPQTFRSASAHSARY